MTMPTLTRYDYYAGPRSLGDLWTARRGDLAMRCGVSTHRLGWELRLVAGSNFLRSQVVRAADDVSSTAAAWREEAQAKGWVID